MAASLGPPSYLRECERRVKRWIRLQLVPSRGEWCHEPIAKPSAAEAPPTVVPAPFS